MDYDPLDPAVRENPYPHYAELRRQPVMGRYTGWGGWAVSRYADAWRILRDAEGYAKDVSRGRSGVPMQSDSFVSRTMASADGPDHARLRGLVSAEFSPKAAGRWEPRIRAIVAELLDALPEARGTVDLMDGFARQLPMRLIAEIIGVPAEDYDLFRRWSDEELAPLTAASPPEAIARKQQNRNELRRYFRETIATARAGKLRRSNALVHALVAARDERDRLSEDELVQFLGLLLVGGNETTMNLIGNTLLLLAGHPGEYRKLRENRTLIPSAIDESLRYDSPIQATLRLVEKPVHVHGVDLLPGEIVIPMLGSANHDPEAFPDADTFRVDREPNANDHLSFSIGIHYCLGAYLSKLEGVIALEGVLDRFAELELAVPRESIHHRPGFSVRGIEGALPVRMRAPAAV